MSGARYDQAATLAICFSRTKIAAMMAIATSDHPDLGGLVARHPIWGLRRGRTFIPILGAPNAEFAFVHALPNVFRIRWFAVDAAIGELLDQPDKFQAHNAPRLILAAVKQCAHHWAGK